MLELPGWLVNSALNVLAVIFAGIQVLQNMTKRRPRRRRGMRCRTWNLRKLTYQIVETWDDDS